MGDLEIKDKPLKEKLLRNKEVKTAPITSRQTTFRPWKAKNISKQAAAGGSVYRVRQEVWSPGLLLAGRGRGEGRGGEPGEEGGFLVVHSRNNKKIHI